MAKHKVPSIKFTQEKKSRIESAMTAGLGEFGDEFKQQFKEWRDNLTPEEIEAIKNAENETETK